MYCEIFNKNGILANFSDRKFKMKDERGEMREERGERKEERGKRREKKTTAAS